MTSDKVTTTTVQPTNDDQARYDRLCDLFSDQVYALKGEMAATLHCLEGNLDDNQFEDVLTNMRELHAYLTATIDKAERRLDSIVELEAVIASPKPRSTDN